MAAYNGVNGHTMTESPLLREILHEEWGFDGVVMSDWFATRSTEAGRERRRSTSSCPAPRARGATRSWRPSAPGEVDEATIDDKVLRILRLAARVGALEGTDAGARARATTTPRWRPSCGARPPRGFVLVRNEAALLPLDRRRSSGASPCSGPTRRSRARSAAAARRCSRPTRCPRSRASATALDVGRVERRRRRARAARACPVATGGPACEVRFLAEDGTVLGTEQRPGAAFNWMGGFGPTCRPTGSRGSRSTPPCAPTSRAPTRSAARASAACRSPSTARRSSTSELELAPGADLVEALMTPAAERAPGRARGRRGGRRRARLRGRLGGPATSTSAARSSSSTSSRRTRVTTRGSSTRSRWPATPTSRSSWSAPPRRSRARASTGRRSRCPAVRTSSCGASPRPTRARSSSSTRVRRSCCRGPTRSPPCCSPGSPGRSSATRSPTCCWASPSPAAGCRPPGRASEDGLPSTQPVDGVLSYDEGLLVGYRDSPSATPAYPFGHGLGYTTWEYGRSSARPARRGRGRRGRDHRRATPVTAAAARSSRCTPARTAASSGRRAGSPASRRSTPSRARS